MATDLAGYSDIDVVGPYIARGHGAGPDHALHADVHSRQHHRPVRHSHVVLEHGASVGDVRRMSSIEWVWLNTEAWSEIDT